MQDDEKMGDALGRLIPFLSPHNAATAQLKQYGYAVVDVMTPAETVEYCDAVWNDLSSLKTGIVRDDPHTWVAARMPQMTHGLIQNTGSGLWPGVSAARAATEPFWASLFSGQQPLSSFDAFALGTPAYQQRVVASGKHQDLGGISEWCHTDQAKGKVELLNHIQGALNIGGPLGPAELRTQLVVPKDGETAQSFRLRFLEAFPAVPCTEKKSFDAEREEWIKHTLEEKQWLFENGQIIAPELASGQMLLWASGTPHASVSGPLPAGQRDRNVRMSVFVSAIPRCLVTSDELRFRQKIIELGRTSGHRVCVPGQKKATYRQCLFGKSGRTYGKTLPTYHTDHVLTDFKRYGGLKRGRDEEAIEDMCPSAVHRATARFCAGYDV